MADVDTSAEAVEQLAVVRHACGAGMGTRNPRDYVVTVSVQDCVDAAATLRALLARAEAAEAERDGAKTALVHTCLTLSGVERQRDAALAERDRLAEARACMRACGWHLAPADDLHGDGVLQLAAAAQEPGHD